MSSIERQISITRGPFFFEDEVSGDVMFQFASDNSTIIGPMIAKDHHKAEYADAYRVFLAAKEAGENPEPEFVQRERRHKPPEAGVSVFDMVNGIEEHQRTSAPKTYVPGETVHPNVGAGGRKAGPEPVAEPPVEPEPAPEPAPEPVVAKVEEPAIIDPVTRGRGRPRKQ